MYTAGHKEILEDALDMFEADYFGGDAASRKALFDAISYPDFPCGQVDVDGVDVVDNLSSCNVARAVNDMFFDRVSMGYQSHNGFYSLWHAMTPDPDKSVSNVAKNVMQYVIICCMLAREKRSMFWLGFALHIIMDSYSPAHVLREGNFPHIASSDFVTWLNTHDSELPEGNRKLVERMRSIVSAVVDGIADGKPLRAIIAEQPREFRRATAFVIFDHMQRKAMPVEVRALGLGERRRKRHRIMNFFYYPHQRGIFHNFYDRMAAVKASGLYRPVVQDVYRILKMFKAATDNREFLTQTYDYLARNTFAVHDGCADVDTGFDINTVMYPKSASMKLFKRAAGSDAFESGDLRVERMADGTFSLPVVRNALTNPEIVNKVYKFRKAASIANRNKNKTHDHALRYTFLASSRGKAFPAYPVSIEVDGAVYDRPKLV